MTLPMNSRIFGRTTRSDLQIALITGNKVLTIPNHYANLRQQSGRAAAVANPDWADRRVAQCALVSSIGGCV